jgi:acyl-CoA dehydrogenase
MTMVPILSALDLPVFFAPHHQELCADLVAHISALEEASQGAGAAARVAALMGSPTGLYAWLLPDGGRADVRSLCLVRELLGYASPLADAIYAVQGLGSYPILLAGSDAQKECLEALKAGTRIAGFALTEPEAGSDVASMRTRAVLKDGQWRLSGHKTLISNVGIAHQFVVFANADPDAGRKGITAFLVDASAAALESKTIELSDDHPIGDLIFDDCPAELLGTVGGGFKLALRTLDRFRVSVGAAAVGMSRRAFDEAAHHVRTRVQFGKPLAEQQLVQAHLANMVTELDASRLMVLRAAHKADTSDEPVTSEAAMAKLFATEAAQRIVDTGVQLLGGRGVVHGNPVEHLYRSVRPLRIYEGTSEIQRLIIGRAIAKA